MRIRASLYGLIAVVSLTSGCACCDNPCWGLESRRPDGISGSPILGMSTELGLEA